LGYEKQCPSLKCILWMNEMLHIKGCFFGIKLFIHPKECLRQFDEIVVNNVFILRYNVAEISNNKKKRIVASEGYCRHSLAYF